MYYYISPFWSASPRRHVLLTQKRTEHRRTQLEYSTTEPLFVLGEV
jgi:hypothetical protein